MAYVVTGTLSPDSTGVFRYAGTYDAGQGAYGVWTRTDDGWSIWLHWVWWGAPFETWMPIWVISAAPGSMTGPYWAALADGLTPDEIVPATYSAYNGATGAATVTYTPAAFVSSTLAGLLQTAAGVVNTHAAGDHALPSFGQVAAGGTVLGAAIAQILPAFAQATQWKNGVTKQTIAAFEQAAAGSVPINAAIGQRLPSFGQGAAAVIVTTYLVDARGIYRVFNDDGYWIHYDTSPPSEASTPDETTSTLPYTTTGTFTGTGTWYLAVQYFNGVIPSGFLPVGPNGEPYLRLDLDGDAAVGSPPKGPIDWALEVRPAGVVRVHGRVYVTDDDDDPDQWAIGYTTNGVDPVEDSPDVSVSFRYTLGLVVLEYDLPAQADGTTVKVRLQTCRSSDSVLSDGSTVKSAVAETIGPDAPIAAESWPGAVPEDA